MLPLSSAASVENGGSYSRKSPDVVDIETKPGNMHGFTQGIRARRNKLMMAFRRRHTDPPGATPMATDTPATPCSPGPQSPELQHHQQHHQHEHYHHLHRHHNHQHQQHDERQIGGAECFHQCSLSGSSEAASSTREPTPELSRSEISQSETSRSRQSPSISTRRNSSFTVQQLELPPPHPRQVGDAAKPSAVVNATVHLPPPTPPPPPVDAATVATVAAAAAATLPQQDPLSSSQPRAPTSSVTPTLTPSQHSNRQPAEHHHHTTDVDTPSAAAAAAASPPSLPSAPPAPTVVASSPTTAAELPVEVQEAAGRQADQEAEDVEAQQQQVSAEPPVVAFSVQPASAPTPANPSIASSAREATIPLALLQSSTLISTTPATATVNPGPERTRKQSLFPAHEISRIATSLDIRPSLSTPEWSIKRYSTGGFGLTTAPELRFDPEMVHGKVWVRRRDGSPTLVEFHESDLVDNLRDSILRKYQNALARHYDAPDLLLKVVPRNGPNLPKRDERTLQPDERVTDIVEEYFGGAQLASEALVVDVPQVVRERKTPRPSPNLPYAYYGGHETIVGAEGTGYFPEMPITQTSHPTNHPVSNLNNSPNVPQQPAISILTSGQAPAVPPSPGTRGPRRPPYRNRMNTASPTVLTSANANINQPVTPIVINPRNNRSRGGSDATPTNINIQNQHSNLIPNQTQIQTPGPQNSSPLPIQSQNQNQPVPLAPQPLPTPPIPEEKVSTPTSTVIVGSPPARVASPRPKFIKDKLKVTKPTPGGKLDSTVPPINVLIVEDNIINLKLLEAFMKRLKVRWQSAMNGREAVTKWRSGGFHLVLMDIQLPVMSGLEATKEIRRLERVNGIGVFSQSAKDATTSTEVSEEDKLTSTEVSEEDKLSSTIVFKSPVIIVALTASSLQSDRHEALAAGCNDFLTKPVNFIWLEKKVTEWGCMQALIDFDGWKKWKDFSQNVPERPVRIGIKRDRQRSGQAILPLGQSSLQQQPLTPSTPGTPGPPAVEGSGEEIPRAIMA